MDNILRPDFLAKYQVYFHKKPNDEIFYVGICKDEERPYDDYKRNKLWKSIVDKYGYNVKIVHSNLSKEQAIVLERGYIELFGRRDLKTGTLVNMTSGGEGTFDLSEETRNSISGKLLGRKNGPPTKETRDKISKANKGTKPTELAKKKAGESAHIRSGKLHYNFGKKRSKETVNKIAKKLKGRVNTPDQIKKWKLSYGKDKILNVK